LSTLSVIVITKNEEANIRDCLQSVRWADELVVLDSGSTDRTASIARELSARVYEAEWEGFGRTKSRALSKATQEWVLSLDADERVPEELASEIQNILRNEQASVSGYSVPRKSYFLGRWIRHCGWYPGRVVRLFKRGAGEFTDSAVHEALTINGNVGELKHDLIHHTDPNLFHYFEKFNRYTSLSAEELFAEGNRASVVHMIVRPWWTFIRMYLLKRGFLDGIQGFILCMLSAAYVFTKYAKLWELRNTGRKEPTP
jgi:glycosyltransferase involved in cell wall biosynthesis